MKEDIAMDFLNSRTDFDKGNNPEEGSINVRFYTDFDVCNYSCPYCIAGQNNKRDTTSRWDPTNFITIIRGLARLPQRINVRLGVGGEFFLNQTLIEGARLLSLAKNVRSLNLITNLSFPIERYEKSFLDFDQSKIAIVASYHPTEIKDKQGWFETALYMNKSFDFAAVLVAYPPLIKDLPAIRDQLNSEGIEVFVQGFIGNYEGREYPAAYSEEEKQVLREVFYSRHDYEFFVRVKKPGLCNAGYRSFYVDMSGLVRPCGMGSNSPVLGNLLIDTRIQLFDGPRPCMFDSCLCDTENLNTVIFEQHYIRSGLNQHKFVYRFRDEAKTMPKMDEWEIEY